MVSFEYLRFDCAGVSGAFRVAFSLAQSTLFAVYQDVDNGPCYRRDGAVVLCGVRTDCFAHKTDQGPDGDVRRDNKSVNVKRNRKPSLSQ